MHCEIVSEGVNDENFDLSIKYEKAPHWFPVILILDNQLLDPHNSRPHNSHHIKYLFSSLDATAKTARTTMRIEGNEVILHLILANQIKYDLKRMTKLKFTAKAIKQNDFQLSI